MALFIANNLALFFLLLAAISHTISAAPQLGLVGHLLQGMPLLDFPLPEMTTKNSSSECHSVNKGSRLCCQSTFNGDAPLLLELAPIIGYRLNSNSVNGIYCKKDSDCLVGTDLCCQVDSFPKVIPTLLNLAMYCQNALKKEGPTPTSY